jgi:plastocyanin
MTVPERAKARWVLIVLVAAVLEAAAPAHAANQTVTATSANQFTPQAVTISQGEMVTWNNTGGSHNVHFDDNSYDMPANATPPPWTVMRTFPATGVFRYYCELHGGPGGAGMSGTVTVTGVPYPRPASATPLRVPLVPEFAQCTSPNSSHVGPIASPACNPPQLQSTQLTTTTTGSASGFVRLRSITGNPMTPADEADVNITTNATQIRRRSDNTAYTGRAILNVALRLTDMGSGTSGLNSATVQDNQLALPADCTSGTCTMNTSADTLVPGLIKEERRMVMDALSVTVKDAGPDGNIGSATCGPNCGTGDEQVFLREGVFTP